MRQFVSYADVLLAYRNRTAAVLSLLPGSGQFSGWKGVKGLSCDCSALSTNMLPVLSEHSLTRSFKHRLIRPRGGLGPKSNHQFNNKSNTPTENVWIWQHLIWTTLITSPRSCGGLVWSKLPSVCSTRRYDINVTSFVLHGTKSVANKWLWHISAAPVSDCSLCSAVWSTGGFSQDEPDWRWVCVIDRWVR